MAKRLTLEKRIRLETLLKLSFDSLMGNLSITKKLPVIANCWRLVNLQFIER